MSTMLPEASPRPANDSIGARIASALTEKQMTQAELARQLVGPDAPESRVESSRRLLNKWIRDLHVPGPVHAQHLAAILDKPTNYFTMAGLTSSSGRTSRGSSEDDSYALEFVFDFALKQPQPGQLKLPKPFGKEEIAELAKFFGKEHILLNEVEDWTADGKSATAIAQLSHDVWALGQWYNDANGLPGAKEIIPGILIIEALAQTSCVALLTDEKYRGRTVLCAGYDHIRLRRTVQSGDWIRIEAEQRGTPHSQVFHYAAEARRFDPTGKDKSDDVVARGLFTLAVH